MRGLIKFVFQVVAAFVLILFLTAVWVMFDGLTDLGEKADVALVMGTPEAYGGQNRVPLLDHTVKLFNDGDFPLIIVSGSTAKTEVSEPQAMMSYLVGKGIPSNAIVIAGAESTPEATRKTADLMQERNLNSVMVITDYYHVTRTKLGLMHDGVTAIRKSHVGKMQQGDAWGVAYELAALYNYVGHAYLVPMVSKLKQEAKEGAEKASQSAESAQKKVDKGLDSMSK